MPIALGLRKAVRRLLSPLSQSHRLADALLLQRAGATSRAVRRNIGTRCDREFSRLVRERVSTRPVGM
jgi:hypothetical protein